MLRAKQALDTTSVMAKCFCLFNVAISLKRNGTQKWLVKFVSLLYHCFLLTSYYFSVIAGFSGVKKGVPIDSCSCPVRGGRKTLLWAAGKISGRRESRRKAEGSYRGFTNSYSQQMWETPQAQKTRQKSQKGAADISLRDVASSGRGKQCKGLP